MILYLYYVIIGDYMENKMSLPLIMAPLAGITDSVCRRIVKSFGADITYSEMISSRGLWYKDKKTKELLYFEKEETPIVIQLFGNEPDIMAYAAKEIEQYNPQGIDINMGCPMPKIVNNGDGCALMKDISLAAKVCEAVAKATKLPVSVKFRSGWDEETLNAVEFAKAMEQSGASLLTVHGRTRVQQYSGKADLSVTSSVKNAVSIPVYHSGDVVDGASALSIAKETGCDGLMIGRGALGSPWIFKEIKAAFEGKEYISPNWKERIDMALKHAKMLCEYKGDLGGIRESRKFSAWYVKGLKGSARLRNDVTKATSYAQLEELFNEYILSLKDGEEQ